MTAVFTLLVLFQIKHWVADYPAQSPSFFIGKFRDDWGFVWPLLVHVGIHALLTFLICRWFGAAPAVAFGLAVFDASVHFVMDRIKASAKWMGRWKPLTGPEWMEATRMANAPLTFDTDSGRAARKRLLNNKLFWISLGFDQLVHHLTDYAVIWYLVCRL